MKGSPAYESLVALNQAVALVLKNLIRLQRLGILSGEFAKSHRLAAEGLRAEANQRLTEILSEPDESEPPPVAPSAEW
jgi:hypothetical protein